MVDPAFLERAYARNFATQVEVVIEEEPREVGVVSVGAMVEVSSDEGDEKS